KRPGDQHCQITRRVEDRKATLVSKKGRHPRHYGVITTLGACSHQSAKQGDSEQWRLKNLEERRPVATRRKLLPRFQVYGRFLDITSHEENQNCRRDSNQEQCAPGGLNRQYSKEHSIEDSSHAPSHCPTRLHD